MRLAADRAARLLAHLEANYRTMYHEPKASFRHPYLIAGAGYPDCLWDWDSWVEATSIFAIMELTDAPAETRARMVSAMQGGILNFLDAQLPSGALTPSIYFGGEHYHQLSVDAYDEPFTHKPVMAQYVHLIWQKTGELDWIRARLPDIERFHAHLADRWFDVRTGLYRLRSGAVIGGDNDPCTFGRPRNSSAAVYFNCLMVRELETMAAVLDAVDRPDASAGYRARHAALVAAMRQHCWCKRDRFFYSVDVQCETERDVPWLNSGLGVFWPCIPLRIRVWTGFMPMWAGVATPEQARDLVRLHLHDREALACDYGIRTLAANEPMYNCDATGNPSNWLGPVWTVVNYLTFMGLVRYGFKTEALELAARTVDLLGRDVETNGGMHEYYHPETGRGIMNLGFMDFNYLVANMIQEARELGEA